MTTTASVDAANTASRRPLDQAIAGARAADEAAADDLLWYCRRIASRSLPPQEVADGSQHLVEIALSRIDTQRGPASCWAYLIAVARTSLRRGLVRRIDTRAQLEASANLDVDRLIDEARLPALVAQLPALKREVVQRFYFRGESVAAIADALGCPVNTIKARLHVARQQLRVLLTRSEGGES